jgi:hypothetical protein
MPDSLFQSGMLDSEVEADSVSAHPFPSGMDGIPASVQSSGKNGTSYIGLTL